MLRFQSLYALKALKALDARRLEDGGISIGSEEDGGNSIGSLAFFERPPASHQPANRPASRIQGLKSV